MSDKLNAEGKENGIMADNFVPGDLRLVDYQLEQIVRHVLPQAISQGLLSSEDIKFLRLWQSGEFFQTAPVPVLFPYDADISDVAATTQNFRNYRYYDDISVLYEGVKYRVLALRGERALPVLMNWLKERGITNSELALSFAIFAREGGSPFTRNSLGLGTKPMPIPMAHASKKKAKVFSKAASARRMAEVKRFANGSIPASQIKKALNEQMKQHGYTVKTFAAGTGLPLTYLQKWCKGEMLVKPAELRKICRHLGVKNLFQGVSQSAGKTAKT